MKKKQSATKQVLNILNTKGGRKPKDLIKELKLPASNVYAALNALRAKKMVAKEEDGVYISQTQTSVSKVPNKTFNDRYTKSLETQVHELERFADQWRQNYKKLEEDYTQAKVMYLNSQAVVAYLEEKVAQLLRG